MSISTRLANRKTLYRST